MWKRSLVSEFIVRVAGKAGADSEELLAVLDKSLASLLEDGITERALASARRSLLVRQVNAALSDGERAKLIVGSVVNGDDPEYYRYRNQVMAAATTDDLKRVARLWLGDGAYAPKTFERPSLPER